MELLNEPGLNELGLNPIICTDDGTAGRKGEGGRCFQAGLTVARTILADPYLSRDPSHQGILLHSVYHRPNGWDYVAEGQAVPNGESSLWGDYHAMELAVYLKRLASEAPYLAFYNI